MHPKNPHQSRYDLPALVKSSPELQRHIIKTKFGDESIDFANPEAVKSLNRAILKNIYGVSYWDIPEGFLCPPIPGRADYLYYLADLLGHPNAAKILDIGVGANCVYPLIGRTFGWSFVGSDIDERALKSAQKIIDENKFPEITLRHQKSSKEIFKGVIGLGEKITATICNPPFHSSAEEAAEGSNRKMKNLGIKNKQLNFGGKSNELWTEGGEEAFIKRMIAESEDFATQVEWFTTLVSKKDSLPSLERALKRTKVKSIKIIEMSQGQKISRILCWSYLK